MLRPVRTNRLRISGSAAAISLAFCGAIPFVQALFAAAAAQPAVAADKVPYDRTSPASADGHWLSATCASELATDPAKLRRSRMASSGIPLPRVPLRHNRCSVNL